jgi:hypothetical protein
MEAKRLAKTLRKGLKADRKARIEAVAVDIVTLLRDNEVHKAYGKLRGWYREKPGHVPKPTFQEEKKTRDQCKALYKKEQSDGEPNPVDIAPFPIDNTVPEEEEVCEALKKLRLGRSVGGTGLSVEDLKKWTKGVHRLEPAPDLEKDESE